MSEQIFKFVCETCGKENEKEIHVPRFCNIECRLTWLRSKRKYNLKDNPSTNMQEEIKTEEIKNGEPATEQPIADPVPTEPTPTENPNSVGQDTPAENPLDAPSSAGTNTPGV
jgi:hypothetical protein